MIKSCLDDDWESGLRFTAVIFMRECLKYLKGKMVESDADCSMQIRDIYPELLKRLDDS